MNAIFAISAVVMKEMIRRKDFYVLFIITALITLVMGAINIFNDKTIAGYLKELALLLIWICSVVMAITASARQLYAEKENRTIFPLLAKPVSRAKFLLGKFFGCWLACGIALFVFYLFLGIVAASREHSIDVGAYMVAILLHWGALGVVIAMALLGSIVFATPASNGTICFIVVAAILLLGRHLNTIALQTGGWLGDVIYGVYYMLPRLDWAFSLREFLVFHNPMPPLLVWSQALLFYVMYAGLLMFASWLLFRRRPLNA
jgi:Cu-processing system permease protein